MISSADFSEDKTRRYLLTRIWDEQKPVAMCIGLNPSKAGSTKDDPTIRRMISTLNHLGYGGLKMVNLYSIISSNPSVLQKLPTLERDNLAWIETTAYSVQAIIFAWGNFKEAEIASQVWKSAFPDALCFGRNKNGSPWHPLAMMYAGIKATEAKLIRYNG